MTRVFIGREQEKQLMLDALLSPDPEMVAVVGRRRVGKTYLIQQVYGDRLIFEATGVQNADKKEQLQNFTFRINRAFYGGKAKLQAKNWLEAFQLLILALDQQSYQEKKVIFLDELPWFDSHKSGFVKALGFFWNSWCATRNIVVVICGSAASWMIEQVVNDRGGLHNRITRKIDLLPFRLSETELFLQKRGVHLDRYQILLIYMVLGGIPHYLKEIRPGQGALEQIGRICSPPHALSNEFSNLYRALFDEADRHVAVIRALAQKRKGLTRKEILSGSGLTDGGGATKVIQELLHSGFISEYYPFGKTKRDLLYRLTDAYSIFFLKFLEHRRWDGTDWWQTFSQTPAFKSWCGYAFENVCLNHLHQIKKAIGISGVYAAASTFAHVGTAEDKGFQIDLVLDRNDQCINLFEFKFYDAAFTIDKDYADLLRTRRELFRRVSKTKKQLFISFLSTYGVKPNVHSTGLVDHNLDFHILFEG